MSLGQSKTVVNIRALKDETKNNGDKYQVEYRPIVTILSLCTGITISPSFTPQDSSASAMKNGELIFKDSCASCHNAHSSDLLIGPGLKGYYKIHQPPPSNATVRKIIHDGKGTMPSFGNLEDTEIDDLIAYLKTL